MAQNMNLTMSLNMKRQCPNCFRFINIKHWPIYNGKLYSYCRECKRETQRTWIKNKRGEKMKQGKKLLRSHKEMLVKLGLDPNNYLLERRGIDENGERFVNLINLKTNKVEKHSM